MTDYNYDLIIIGSGPSGRTAAIQAGKLHRRVLVIDRKDRLGGVSVHTGTVPSKTLRETVLNLSGWRERSFYGRAYRVKDQIQAEDLKARLHMTLDHEVDVLEHQFNRNHVEVLPGLARFVGPNEVEVATEAGDTTRVTGEKFLIATGTRTYRPDYVPFNGKTVVDGDEFLEMEEIPRSLVVVGAGVIGVEYATMFSALDVRVTLIEPRDTFLDFIDSTLIQDFTHQIRENGVDLRLGSAITKIEDEGSHIEVSLENGRHVRGDMLLFAAGRMGNTEALNLEAVGLETDHRGRLSVDRKSYQTTVPHIYATGDVIGHPSLASTSLQQGRVAACHALETPTLPESPWFPYGIYSVPEMSTCGMSEEELQERGIPYEIGIARFRETSRGHIMGLEHGMLKMLFSLKTRRVLGVQIVGEGATELIHIAQAVLNLKGTVDYFVQNTFNYPTLAEAYKIAGLDAFNRMPIPDEFKVKKSDAEKPKPAAKGKSTAKAKPTKAAE
ncbi:Si-specific NAD(P)(+) transhydrogenase [Phaeobacter gallaeciensis]|uniref:Soluble pyridine nucleotide transhydrogenase n=1 Tax=Phaeobacter gallaeciensis TaxID=60890 RepID=A0AAD0EBD3_9RHOB|nr:Si-specific NAD(P)(+) transhydrogenase [Phaeobacter gallaeciensis]AHD07890.1 Pyruvate/2-oxoglutarate dehydrogenase complex, dihydrolipoamide dehydrogenase (E3) component [Phaeobacter gallaeciensis DSM 26640]ATE91158.1 putative soluble pyridine nucleotide transhydrogenase [Phaeobacter gallaeciensis]ATE95433.1 putative soluble pyridine nucleotide transhydrogenase [Phaeobacter gallaeciensis]ATE99772.1 putative soluble pyridine nucleotide transhydrogenase [Phaeobacter gallaeciensis]ATF04205.1 p